MSRIAPTADGLTVAAPPSVAGHAARHPPGRAHVPKIALLLAVSVGIAGCGLPSGHVQIASPHVRPKPDRFCHDLPAHVCDQTVARALTMDPRLAQSPRITVAAAGAEFGDDLLVAFAPFGEGDMWSPAVLLVRPSRDWAVDYWKVGSVPSRFVELMIADGVGPP